MTIDSKYYTNLLQFGTKLPANRYVVEPIDDSLDWAMGPQNKMPSWVEKTRQDGYMFNASMKYTSPDDITKILSTFCATDSPENYKEQLELHGKNWKWADTHIEYDINELGYRAPQFDTIDWKNSLPVFGCSTIFGTGLANEQLCSTLAAEAKGYTPVNFGYPGGSNETILRNIVSFINNVSEKDFPKNIIVAWTCIDRTHYYDDMSCVHVGPWSAKDNTVMGDYMMAYNMNKYHANITLYYLAETVRALLKGKTNLIEISFYPDTAVVTNCHWTTHKQLEPKDIREDRARDDLHHGPKCHKMTAEYIIGKMI